ncbi:prolactin-releasing peptide receptor-like [Haliotis cracherodii]|uniref:prolactin-releasing peptide receptor-like n=1 Tax=Haliotis cracherodii TaxID=6455 RepID=UPI0039E9F016
MACLNRTILASTRELFVFHMPTVIFLLLVLMFGIFGNLLVLYIYTQKIRVVIFGFFVRVLAIFDIVTTCVAVPASLIFVLTSPGYIDAEDMCQMMTFVKHVTALNSGLMFIIIAVQRYKKVCQPNKSQMSEMLAKKLCLTSVCVSAVASMPIIFVVTDTMICIESGRDFVLVPICDFTSDTKRSLPAIMYATWVGVELVGITTTLTVLYSVIVKALRANIRDIAASIRPTQNSSRDVARTATITFFVLTVVFLISSAPMAVLTIYLSLVKFDIHWSHAQVGAYELAVNLMFLNCAINPFVYSSTSSVFRRELKHVLRSLTSGEQTSSTQ